MISGSGRHCMLAAPEELPPLLHPDLESLEAHEDYLL